MKPFVPTCAAVVILWSAALLLAPLATGASNKRAAPFDFVEPWTPLTEAESGNLGWFWADPVLDKPLSHLPQADEYMQVISGMYAKEGGESLTGQDAMAAVRTRPPMNWESADKAVLANTEAFAQLQSDILSAARDYARIGYCFTPKNERPRNLSIKIKSSSAHIDGPDSFHPLSMPSHFHFTGIFVIGEIRTDTAEQPREVPYTDRRHPNDTRKYIVLYDPRHLSSEKHVRPPWWTINDRYFHLTNPSHLVMFPSFLQWYSLPVAEPYARYYLSVRFWIDDDDGRNDENVRNANGVPLDLDTLECPDGDDDPWNVDEFGRKREFLKANHIRAFWPTHLFSWSYPRRAALNVDLKRHLLDMEKSEKSIKRSNAGGFHSTNDLFDKHRNAAPVQEVTALTMEAAYHFFTLMQQHPFLLDNRIVSSNFSRWRLQTALAGSWTCINRRADNHEPHTHSDTVSGVYYIDNGGDNETSVYHIDPRPGAGSLFSDIGRPFGIGRVHRSLSVPGTILLFPSWLTHYVNPHYSEEPRVAISFNLRVGFSKDGEGDKNAPQEQQQQQPQQQPAVDDDNDDAAGDKADDDGLIDTATDVGQLQQQLQAEEEEEQKEAEEPHVLSARAEASSSSPSPTRRFAKTMAMKVHKKYAETNDFLRAVCVEEDNPENNNKGDGGKGGTCGGGGGGQKKQQQCRRCQA